ncbi:hypothetical protein VPNG_07347 [Cytospora leucostoma]|uniref:Uncharacterized protein n=1 Tax=Cytospora leucostoma TaxID=1230097 RepID=A0A423WUD5_9PEZI|nr:hypothetical protein VPNG_07347 [Cytospora leucostoma]
MTSPFILTPETSPEPEEPAQYKSLYQATTQKRKRSWPVVGVEGSVKPGALRAVWENDWKPACKKGSHPFQDGRLEDFEPIFDDLIEAHVDDPTSPEYTLAFLSRAQELSLEAEDALARGDRGLASELYLRACAVLRIARLPRSQEKECSVKQRAWQFQKSLYLKAGKLWHSPLEEVIIPHIHDIKTQDCDVYNSRTRIVRPRIPLYVRLPAETLDFGRTCPAVLIVSGDDRTAHTRQCGEALRRGWGCVVAEVPGAGDCPVSAEEGGDAADGLWSSVLDWMKAMRVFDMDRVVVWGSGESVVRMAGTHGDRLGCCVAVFGDGGEGDLPMLDEVVSCSVLVVTGGGESFESDGLGMPVDDDDGLDDGDNNLSLFEYGAPDTSVVQYPRADSRAVYDWVGKAFDSK